MAALRLLPGALALLLLAHAGAMAQDAAQPAAPQIPNPGAPAVPPSPQAPYQANLLGNVGGLRDLLNQAGIAFVLTDNTETLANADGGIRRAAVVEGLGFGSLSLDGKQAFGLDGFSALISAWGIYGRGLNANALGNLDTISNLEADRSVKLFELWVEQSLWGGLVSLRIGQQALDQEFMVDANAGIFFNAHFGFPDLPSNDLPGGAPVFPLGTPAVRLRLQPDKNLTLLAALFSGDPAPNGPEDPQNEDEYGTAFNLRGGALWVAEAQWADGAAKPGTYKFGAWYNTENFPDQRLDSLGQPLASPLSNGQALQRHGDWSLYALADKVLWRPAGASDGGIAGFIRCMGAPGDRNLVEFSADGGITWKGILPSRPHDTAGIGVEWARVGDQASKADGDIAYFTHSPYPVRRWETVVELTYQIAVTPWFQIQPDFQYVVRPGGGIPDPENPGQRAGNAAVFGLRGIVTF